LLSDSKLEKVSLLLSKNSTLSTSQDCESIFRTDGQAHPNQGISVRNKPHAWDASRALNAGHSMVSYIHTFISSNATNRAFNKEYSTASPTTVSSFTHWPVFRVTFTPAARGKTAQLKVRELQSEEFNRKEGRIGIVTKEWFAFLMNRRTRNPT